MAIPTVKSYSPGDVNLYLNGIQVDQFANNSFIIITYSDELWRAVNGAKGDVTFVKNLSLTSGCKFRLKRTSIMHGLLEASFMTDKFSETNNDVFPPFLLTYSATLALEGVFKIQTPSPYDFIDVSKGNDEPVREWTLTCALTVANEVSGVS